MKEHEGWQIASKIDKNGHKQAKKSPTISKKLQLIEKDCSADEDENCLESPKEIFSGRDVSLGVNVSGRK